MGTGTSFLHAVQGNPPNRATGRVGAVGHIHLICIMIFINHKKEKHETKITPIYLLSATLHHHTSVKTKQLEGLYAYVWKRKIFQLLRPAATTLHIIT